MPLSLYFYHKLKPNLKLLGFKARQSIEDQKSFLVLKDKIYIKLHYFETFLSLIKKMQICWGYCRMCLMRLHHLV